MTLLRGLINKAHKEFLNTQKILRFVSTEQFSERVEGATVDQIKELETAIESNDLDAIKEIVRNLMLVKHWHIKRLRQKARALHIPQWYNKSKDQLIKAINAEIDT